MEAAGLMERLCFPNDHVSRAALYLLRFEVVSTGCCHQPGSLNFVTQHYGGRDGIDPVDVNSAERQRCALGIAMPSIMLIVLGCRLGVSTLVDLFRSAFIPSALLALADSGFTLDRCWATLVWGPSLPKTSERLRFTGPEVSLILGV
jgi:hypothetical protein